MSIPYLFAIPDYSRISAGIRITHRLIHLLNTRGFEAYSNTPVINLEWNEKYANDKMQRELAYHGIVLYPEIVDGNPLHARRVVRYVCNVPGYLGGETTYHPNEVVFYYNQFLRKYAPSDDRLLEIPSIETDLFNNREPLPREKGCFYFGKASNYGLKPIPETQGLVEITRENNGWPKTRKELAELLRRSKIFYCYDNFTALLDEARLCGCPTVMVYPRPDGLQETLDKGYSIDGLAFGIDPSEIDRACKTVDKYADWYLQSISGFDAQLENFIRITQTPESYGKTVAPANNPIKGYHYTVLTQTQDQFSRIRRNYNLAPEFISELYEIISSYQNKVANTEVFRLSGNISEVVEMLLKDENQPIVRFGRLIQIMVVYIKLNGLDLGMQGNPELSNMLINMADYARRILSQIDEYGNKPGKNPETGTAQDTPVSSIAQEALNDVNVKREPVTSGSLQPDKVLEMLLESDDLLSSLDTYENLLNEELLTLVKQNALFARQDNESDLAEGLDYLASYIEKILAQRKL